MRRHIAATVERLLGAAVVAQREAAGGYTLAANRIVSLADGRTVFVKIAVDELTQRWLRAENAIYSAVTGSFLPRRVAWEDDALGLRPPVSPAR